jgi:hypothetical protein
MWIGIVIVSIALMAHVRPVLGQDDRLQKIEQRLNVLEQRNGAASSPFDSIKSYIPGAFAIMGIGLFCGLWARNSGRDFWLWFVAGLVFNLFTLVAVADVHEKDKKVKRDAEKKTLKEALDL